MTAKRKPDGELEVVKWGLSTQGFRVALLVLVLSMHPLGRQLLATFGFQFPDQKRITEAADQVTLLQAKVDGLAKDVDTVKTSQQALTTKVETLDHTITGFQIDFTKYKTEVTK